MKAYWKEWDNLESKKVWSWDTLTEWDTVSRKYRSDGKEVHIGYLFGFMVIKGDEFPEGDPRRRWKYRVVFQGNQVKDQDWQVALFQAMATAPATLEASRIANLYACSTADHSIQCRGVEQAYITADLGGTPTYVVLPKELWSAEMMKMKCPVVRLDKALYGHKNSGAFWNRHCDQELKKLGFEPLATYTIAWTRGWPSATPRAALGRSACVCLYI